MARRKSLKATRVDTIEELVYCIKNLKEEFEDYKTQIEIFEDTMFGGWFIEIWKL